jgi:hypothetical protein
LKFSGSGIERQTGDPGVARALPANMSLRLEANARTQPSLKKPDVGGTQPDNGETLLTNRPTLSWWSEKTHESFELRLIDCGTEIDSCSGSPSRVVLRSRAWRPSAEDALEWGHFYRWSVTPLKNPRAAQGGWFWVISPDHLEVLAALHPGESRETANLVLYAQALEEVGARAEAREIWQQLANLRPEQRGFVCKAAGRPVEQCRRMSQSDGY